MMKYRADKQYGKRHARYLWLLLSAVLLSACAGGPQSYVFDKEIPYADDENDLFPTETLAEGVEAPPRHLRLDVGVMEFDPNYTLEQAKSYEVYPEVRKAEAKYYAVRLRDKIREQDYWNSVWVVPDTAVTDIKVSARIIRSDGRYLELAVKAMDSKGGVLLRKIYKETATQYDYSAGRKPFDNLFQRIADDLVLKTAGVDADDTMEIRETTDLRFVRWLAPEMFARGNERRVVRSAAYRQAVRLREYDALFFDKLQDYYNRFNLRIKESHTKWSQESYLEIEAKEEAQSEARKQAIGGALLVALGIAAAVAGSNSSSTGTQDAALVAGAATAAGGSALVYDAQQKYKRSEIHDEAIRELGAALESEVKPHTVTLEGEVVRLDGSIKEQYLLWQSVLKKHHRAATAGGF